MYHVEKYLNAVCLDEGRIERETMTTRPLLAARALAELSLRQAQEPIRLKKNKPVFRHYIDPLRRSLTVHGGQFAIDVRLRTDFPLDTDKFDYFASRVASMQVSGDSRAANFEFSPEGHTSIHGASSIDIDKPWSIANAWHPIDPSVAAYVQDAAQ